MKEISLEVVHKELEVLKKSVKSMQEHIEDCFLTAEEERSVEKAREELEKGVVVPLEDFELERKNAQG